MNCGCNDNNIDPNKLIAIGAFLTLAAAFLSFVSSLIILKQGQKNAQQIAIEEAIQDIEEKLTEIQKKQRIS